MPQVVEDAGGELGCGYLHKLIRRGRRAGVTTLGGRAVRWQTGPGGVRVTHPAADPAAGVAEYVLAVDRTRLPSGGARVWWACPGCGRRADSLYLPAGRDRLGCRGCCRLAYRSQLTRTRGGPRKGRPALWETRTTEMPVRDPRTGTWRLVVVGRSERRL